ncbi:MAG: AMP-binding protein [SAR202 cluster bacterium]|nr:AMP-binding protein [SAR202 cluster bacterium]
MAFEMLTTILESGWPKATAVVVPGGPTLTYAALRDEVERVAALLAGAGLRRGGPVSIILGNSLEYLVTFLAATRAGAVAAPLNPAYTAAEFRFYMEDAGTRLALLPPGPHEARKAAVTLSIPVIEATSDPAGRVHLSRGDAELTARRDREPSGKDDVALFLHTSGTTSRPKGVPLTHGNLLASLKNIRETYKLTPQDVAMVVMPLFHVHGLLGVAFATFSSGGSIVVPPKFSAGAFWEVQHSSGATWYSAVPTIHKILLDRADQDSAPHKSFRFIRSCSSPLSASLLGRVEERFGAPVLEAYGMTEASHQMSSNPLPPGRRLAGTVGQGTGVRIAIMDENGFKLPSGERGEVVIQGPNVTRGYRNNPGANTKSFTDGWFRTGDQGFLSPDGYLTLTGRLKELINRGGEKISPIEVEEALLAHPAVSEVVCFALPDAKYGEAVQAAVVLRTDCGEAALRVFCQERLAAFKVPDRIFVAEELPRTATGKVQRRHVAAKFAGQA